VRSRWWPTRARTSIVRSIATKTVATCLSSNLTSLADLDGVVVRAKGEVERATDANPLDGVAVRGKAVVVHTGWDAHWKTDQYFEGHPFLTKDAAQLLADEGAALVGIDSYNIDDTADLS